MRGGWYTWDLAWIATTYFGAKQNKNAAVIAWAEHIADAFVAGAWMLVWTESTLFWVPKPTVNIERGSWGRRPHCEDGPACSNEIENLYFWHGVLVPAYAVVKPEWITLKEIEAESNSEVRRVLIERFGWEKYLRESNAEHLDGRFNERDQQWEHLYATKDGQRRIVVADPSTGRRYAMGVPSEIRTCDAAQHWASHGLDRHAIHRS